MAKTRAFSSGVLGSTDPLALVQVSGDSAWFTVTRNTADTDGLLSSAWAEATDGTATYSLVYPFISFSAGIGEILKIQRYGVADLKRATRVIPIR